MFAKKEICPICGRAIKGDVRIRIKDNVELCKNCSAEIDMDSALIPTMTVEDIKAHLFYREENRKKLEQFSTSWSAEAGAYVLRADKIMRLWYCTNNRSNHNPPLYGFEDLLSAIYLEDGQPVEDEVQTGIKGLFAEKPAPALVQSMKIIIKVDNPYHHEIDVETLAPGKGVTNGTMQYKMNRKAVQNMMFALDNIMNYTGEEEAVAPASEGEAGGGMPEDGSATNSYAMPESEAAKKDPWSEYEE